MKTVNVDICPMYSDVTIPEYKTSGSAGCDIRAYIKDYEPDTSEKVSYIYPGDTKLINTGIKVKVPEGYYMAVVPRSGLSLKTKMRIANSPGTVDSDYILEVGIIVDNIGRDRITISHGDRIAQLLFLPCYQAIWKIKNNLEKTERIGGFGSTGIK